MSYQVTGVKEGKREVLGEYFQQGAADARARAARDTHEQIKVCHLTHGVTVTTSRLVYQLADTEN